MATSGSKSVKFTDYDTLRWSWSVKSLSPSTNEATIAWKAEIISAEHGRIESTNAKQWTLKVMDYDKVQGSEYSGTAYIAVDDYETKEVASGEFTIGHTASAYGRTSVEFVLELAINFGGNYIQSTKVNCGFTLDAPPKGAMILSATNFTDEQNPSIEYSLDYLSVSTLRASITVGSYTLTRTIPIVSRGSYTFELTQSERNSIARQVTDSLYGKARFTISTSLSGSSIDHSLDKEVRIVNAAPTLAPTYTINGDYTYILAEQNSINVACNATAQKGARIVSQSITCGSKKINAGSGTLTDITVNTINFSAVDSRGVQTATSLTVDMIPYKKLTCNIESTNPVENDDGTVTVRFNISGAFYNGGFNDGGSPNALTLNYRTKIDGTYSEWAWLNSTLRNDSYTASLTFTLRPTQQISVEVQAEDAINSFITTLVSKQLQPVFDWSSTDFNFNVPVSIKGVEIPTVVGTGSFSHMPNGTFYWRKWSDGTAEIWGKTSVTENVQTVWGDMFTTGRIDESNISYPFTFAERPSVVTQLECKYTGGILMVSGDSSTPASSSNTGTYEIVRATAVTNASYTICYNIKGKWK